MDIKEIIEKQREYFAEDLSLKFDFRIYELKKLKRAVKAYEPRLIRALNLDLGKSEFESYETEIGVVYQEIDHALDKLWSWMRPRRVKTPLTVFPSVTKVYPTPKGVVLIMSPWNYPVLLTLSPLIGAISAGNCAVIKPSRYSENVSSVLKDMIGEYFAPKYICLVEGGRNVNSALLEEDFDHIFFTGSPKVGKIAMAAAAEHLTPVTLELGGKSPCIVDDSADIDLAAKKIIWGKCVNAGQTCIAPDYVLLHSYVRSKFFKALEKYIKEFFGEDPINNPEFPKIINRKHFDRLSALLDGENVVYGGRTDENLLKIEPTIIDAAEGSKFMDAEIFGPVLPVVTVDTLDEAYTIIEKHPHPLALYLFTTRSNTEKYVTGHIQFGGGCINDVIMHIANENAPFGGVRHSGIGSYHGKNGFDTFTHYKTVLKSGKVDVKARYAPYKGKIKLLRKIMK